jgi:imidazoleglycerol-phosphate dehydratase
MRQERARARSAARPEGRRAAPERSRRAARRAAAERRTGETRVQVRLALDGRGRSAISTGVGFFDHMLELLARHALLDLEVRCRGDLHVDAHHSVEDVGIVLGDALRRALGDKRGVRRFGAFVAPLDEALARAVVDLSGRPYLVYRVPLRRHRIGEMDSELFEDFFTALSDHARMNLHLDLLRGRNSHHCVEACFKAFARALREAVSLDPRERGVPSTKGAL